MSKWTLMNGVLTPIENTEQPERSQQFSGAKTQRSTSRKRNMDVGIVDPSWELIDPTPDIFAMFVQFDQRFFWNSLGSCEIKWSKRMTSCAGTCAYRGRLSSCVITLSEPLLKLRPRKDLVETMLHEMIHAYLFITQRDQDRDGHGPNFQAHMHRINGETGTAISIYHSFHAEVAVYKQHWWRCDGPCRNDRPFHGWVKRAMNRAPGPSDRWWKDHKSKCSGTFVKVKEPEKVAKPNSSKRKSGEPEGEKKPKSKKGVEVGQQSITKWVGTGSVINAPKVAKPAVSSTKKWMGGSGKVGSAVFSGLGVPSPSTSGLAKPILPALSSDAKKEPEQRPVKKEPEIIDLVPKGYISDYNLAIALSKAESQKKTQKPPYRDELDDIGLAIAMSLSQNSDPMSQPGFKRPKKEPEVIVLGNDTPSSFGSIICPSCGTQLAESSINGHLDLCLT
ncbi:hypothetical protein L596_011817 [Steinernema carpocapsae]|uniref:Protein with SprT-like domain at the N terminus n=1 Tax=Steinernema carpocapsae TaxID=34508 RepID=A0A4U5NVG0_STECR|nr:hypothetical protein L596_011817 [Steinernema carpocapsae]